MRWSVRHGVDFTNNKVAQQMVFQGLSEAIWTPEKPRRSARARVFLSTSEFHTAYTDGQTEKTTLPRASANVTTPIRRHRLHIRVQECQPASLSPVISYDHSA